MPTWGKREAFETIAGEEATRLGAVFERFVAKRPISVVVRETLERVLGADQLVCGMLASRRSNTPVRSCFQPSMM